MSVSVYEYDNHYIHNGRYGGRVAFASLRAALGVSGFTRDRFGKYEFGTMPTEPSGTPMTDKQWQEYLADQLTAWREELHAKDGQIASQAARIADLQKIIANQDSLIGKYVSDFPEHVKLVNLAAEYKGTKG